MTFGGTSREKNPAKTFVMLRAVSDLIIRVSQLLRPALQTKRQTWKLVLFGVGVELHLSKLQYGTSNLK